MSEMVERVKREARGRGLESETYRDYLSRLATELTGDRLIVKSEIISPVGRGGTFYVPILDDVPWKKPKQFADWSKCVDCGRPKSTSAGQYCRECWHSKCRARYLQKKDAVNGFAELSLNVGYHHSPEGRRIPEQSVNPWEGVDSIIDAALK